MLLLLCKFVKRFTAQRFVELAPASARKSWYHTDEDDSRYEKKDINMLLNLTFDFLSCTRDGSHEAASCL
jgi:hypothetical protein